jgi:hemoglobin
MSERDSIESHSQLPFATRGDDAVRDLVNRADVEALLRRFYGRVFADETLEEPFSELREKGLESHLPVMCDFWATVLFRAGLYRGNAFHVHRQLDERHPLGANHFGRWLTLWEVTVDEMYQGLAAERAKVQAARIAKSMHRRLTGSDASELETSVAGGGRSPTLR